MPLLLAVSPIAAIFLWLVILRRSGLETAVVGWGVAVLASWLYFNTSLGIVLLSSLHGVLTALIIALILLTAMWLARLLTLTGDVERMGRVITAFAADREAQAVLIGHAMTSFFNATGTVAEAVTPPLLMSVGFEAETAAGISLMGYAGVSTFVFVGAPLLALSAVDPVIFAPEVVGPVAGALSLVATTLMAFAILWYAGGWRAARRGWKMALLSGGASGLGVYLTARFVSPVLAGIVGGGLGTVLVAAALRYRGRGGEVHFGKAERRAFIPYASLVACLSVVNVVPPVFRLTHDTLALRLSVLPGRVAVVRPVWEAWFWILVAFAIAVGVLRPGRDVVRRAIGGIGWGTPLSVLFYGALAQVMALSGGSIVGGQFAVADPARNMIAILATSVAEVAGTAYPLAAPYVGLVGAFLTGGTAANNLLFGRYQIITGELIGVSPVLLGSAASVGAGVASLITPLKAVFACGVAGIAGREGDVVRRLLLPSVVICGVVGAVVWAVA